MSNFPIVVENYKLTIENKIRNIFAKINIFGIYIPNNLEAYNLPRYLKFKVTYNVIDKSYFIECISLPAIYSSARDIPSLIENFNEAIYETFDIPRASILKLGIQYKFRQEFVERLENMAGKSSKNKNKNITIIAHRNQFAPAY